MGCFASVLFRDGDVGGFRRMQLFAVFSEWSYGARGAGILSVK